MDFDKEQIIAYLANYFHAKKDNIEIIGQLLGGMSNRVYHIAVDGLEYTIRIPGKNAYYFVDRRVEHAAILVAEGLDITNETIYFDFETGIKISKYVQGDVLTEVDIDDYLDDIVASLKILHTKVKDFPYKYDMVNRLERYESYNDKSASEYYYLKNEWLKLYYNKYQHDELVFCHGDAQRSNFVKGISKMYLFDFEYSGQNSIYYDIASFGNVSFLDSIKLLEKYIGHIPAPDELDKLRFYRLFQVLQWHQVARFKDKIGLGADLKLDFNKIALKYLEIAGELFANIKEK